MKQENIWIGDIQVPVIIDKDEKWYPINYIGHSILLRNKNVKMIHRNNEHIYGKYTKQIEVDFNFRNAGKQKAKCISEDGLKLLLSNTTPGRLTVEQKKAQNKLLVYFGMNELAEVKEIIDKISKEELDRHSGMMREMIDLFANSNTDFEWKRCVRCEKYYPMNEQFFNKNDHMKCGYQSTCRSCMIVKSRQRFDSDCSKGIAIEAGINIDDDLKDVYDKYGDIGYEMYKNEDYIGIYKQYIKINGTEIPLIINNKDTYLKIIKYLLDAEKIDIHNITIKNLRDGYRLVDIKKFLKEKEIYTYLFGESFYLYPWKYKNFIFKPTDINLTFDIANKVFDNYLEEHEIVIDNILDFDYHDIAKKSKIRKVVDNDLLYFAVQYNMFNYPGYKYKIAGVNYYKSEENRLFDMKYLIEKDMKLQLEKIPLYLTLTRIRSVHSGLYYMVKKYYSNLFEIVNKIYPDKFVEDDFVINKYRDEFDSQEESQLYDLLKDKLENLLYNPRNTERTIEINGMIPDFISFTDNGVYLIEYFGLWNPDGRMYNSRARDYREVHDKKLHKYNEIHNYKKIFLYPYDLHNNFEGVLNKIKEII